MIGKLTGRVDYRASDHVLLDVGGVGYVVYCSERTLANLPNAGQVASLYTELLVREDLLQLFGFLTPYDREWHRLLVSVQGVGAKAAMAISGALGTEALARAIAIGDWGAVKAAPGVGPKLAQRVVNELKDKGPALMAMGGSLARDLTQNAPAPVVEGPQGPVSTPAASPPPATTQADAQSQAEAISALTNLGYGPSDAASAVARAADEADTTPALIRAALRLLAPKD
ncbi:Holliday junction branch migration protein RuvA [Roseobacter sp. HKCCA0882]|uniref:Holliday junction branch migration protein RuvA n=1 Tax=Roseobacter sp. HKCCA0882 TaxID=3120337 RepID=UPI0030ED8417